MSRLIMIGGPMGVGKSAVCRELLQVLPDGVWLDGDWCWNARPFVVNDVTKAVALDNICHCLNNFISCGQYKNIIFSWVMHRREIIQSILARLDLKGVGVFNVTLLCSPDVLVRRLEGDMERGLRTAGVTERALDRLVCCSGLDTIKIDTSALGVRQVADEILKLVGNASVCMRG